MKETINTISAIVVVISLAAGTVGCFLLSLTAIVIGVIGSGIGFLVNCFTSDDDYVWNDCDYGGW